MIKRTLVWATSVLIAHLLFQELRFLFMNEQYFLFSILIALIHDYGDRWRNWFLLFFITQEVKNEQQ